ncbi:MAG: hypothetical protein GY805_24025 [Chloroflexi bacterium]|nr:hypothetical protein [Chloroflexota bacterium]
MKNGNAFRIFTDETVQFLSGLKVVIYYAEPIPSKTDERLHLIVTRFRRGTAVEQEQFQRSLAQEHRSLFGIFGHRAATLSVRQNSYNWLLSGLVGAIIANYIIPPKRNVDVSLAVYHHCAKKIDISPADLFTEAAQFAQSDLAQKLQAFGHRADISLRKFGWQERKTPDGIRYKFSW